MPALKFHATTVGGKPQIFFEKDTKTSPEKRHFDYKSRDQRFSLRDYKSSPEYKEGESIAEGSICTMNSSKRPPPVGYRPSSLERGSTNTRNSRGVPVKKAGQRGGPQRRASDDDSVTLTQAQLSALLASASRGDLDLKPGSRQCGSVDNNGDLELSERKAAPRKQQPASTTKGKRPQAENVMGLLAKMESKDSQRQPQNKRPPPAGMKRRDAPPPSQHRGKPDPQHYDDDDYNSSPPESRPPPASRDHYHDRRSEHDDEEEDVGGEREAGGSAFNLDALMQRVIEENRDKMSEQELLELLTKVYVQAKKDGIEGDFKPAEHGSAAVETMTSKQPSPPQGRLSISEVKRQQWEKEREELASISSNNPWSGSQQSRSGSRIFNTGPSQGAGGGNTAQAMGSSRSRAYDSASQLLQMQEESGALGFGPSRDASRKKEAERKEWLDGLNAQRTNQRIHDHQTRQEKQAPMISSSSLRDRPF